MSQALKVLLFFLFIFAVLAVAIIGALFFFVQDRDGKADKTRGTIQSLKSEFVDECVPGAGRDSGEALLSRLGFTLYYMPKAKFTEGNFLSVFPAIPPAEADGYVLGRTQFLGTLGLFQAYLEAIIFVRDDGRIISCLIKTRSDGL